jgi:hypothetical protein
MKLVGIGKDGAPFTHRHMVRGIKGTRGKRAEISDVLALDSGTQSIAAILDHPDILFGTHPCNFVSTKWISKRVRRHD